MMYYIFRRRLNSNNVEVQQGPDTKNGFASGQVWCSRKYLRRNPNDIKQYTQTGAKVAITRLSRLYGKEYDFWIVPVEGGLT